MSNIGTWIHEVGAGWLMADLAGSPEMVASVRTMMALPTVFLAIPAGVLADRYDRRRLLVATQVLLLSVTATLAVTTWAGIVTPTGLLLFTLLIGLGWVIHIPTWQASIPELVPRSQLPQAVALGSISFNLARSIGPAIGGVLIVAVGVWAAFAVNAISFAIVTAVLLVWRRESTESTRGLTFTTSMFQGIRYVRRNRVMRHVMMGVMLFAIPASAFWAFLPLLVKTRLGGGPDGFGLLVTCVGGGALIGAVLLGRARDRLGVDATVATAMLTYAAALAVLALTTQWWLATLATLAAGVGWMMTLTTLNSTAQITLPRRLRARGMGCYMTAFAFSMSVGSLAWGQLGAQLGIVSTQLIAAGCLAIAAVVSLSMPLAATR